MTLPLLVANRQIAVPAVIYSVRGDTEHITLELALDDPGIITLHPDQLNWLAIPAPTDGGEGVPVGWSFSEGEMTILPRRDIGAEADPERAQRQMELTVMHATALQERKLKGTIGLGFLRQFQAEIDLPARELRLKPLDPSRPPARGSIVMEFDLSTNVIALPLQGGGEPAHVILGSSQPESRVKPASVESTSLVLASTPQWNLAQSFAFRPKDWARHGPNRAINPVAVTGIELLESHRVTIDWQSLTVAFTPTRDVAPEVGNVEFFAAERADTPDALEAFLTRHPQNYFAGEASARLVALRFEEWGASDEDLLRAARWRIETMPIERRVDIGRHMVEQIGRMVGRSELALQVGQLALEHSRAAIAIQEVYRLHRVMGAIHLQADNLDAAWRHLMSATFVEIPTDGNHGFLGRFHLGQVYERQNRLSRAYSRYRAALAVKGPSGWAPPPELKAEAEAALARLRERIPADELKVLDEQ